tara:strand:- start:306 stop:1016 length:711 start_codon:yes stop_codon:yes gene_type:complete
MNSLIILAGGLGKRANQKNPKQFFLLDKEKQVRIMYLQYPYLKNKKHEFDEIIIVVPQDWVSIVQKEIKKICPISKVIAGGETRTKSSYLGLSKCSDKCKNVLIHDAARPFASEKIYQSCINYLNEYDAVIPIIEARDTPLYIEQSEKKEEAFFLNRESLKSIQTPQAFKYRCIKTAYDNKTQNKTDDLQILLEYKPSSKIRFINGEDTNFKITTQQDIQIIKALYDNDEYKVLYI